MRTRPLDVEQGCGTLNRGNPTGRLPGVDAAHTANLLPGGKGHFDPMRFVGVGLSQQ